MADDDIPISSGKGSKTTVATGTNHSNKRAHDSTASTRTNFIITESKKPKITSDKKPKKG